MKLLKSAPSLLLALMFALLLSIPASALNDEFPEERETAPVTVCTLDELLTAIESAESGDTIILQNKIVIVRNCTIGQVGKRITIIPANDFDGDALIEIWTHQKQSVTLQNIILDGVNRSALSAIYVYLYDVSDAIGSVCLTNVEVKNFISNHSSIYVNRVSAIFNDCQFFDNIGLRTAGIEIAPMAEARISGCTFTRNISAGNGGALRCWGRTQIERTTIMQNQAIDTNSARLGGGIYIDQQAFCEISNC